MKKCVAVGRTG